MKIIAVLPVKNEAWVLKHCLQSLTFCDEILAMDDGSNDATREILEQYQCTIFSNTEKMVHGWGEYEIRSFLLQQARKRRATHIVAIDGDEAFSDIFVKEAQTLIADLKADEALAVPWIDVLDEKSIQASFIPKAVIWRDGGDAVYPKNFMHIPRVPGNPKTKTLTLPYALLHFKLLNKQRDTYKQIWYMMSELLETKRTAFQINVRYDLRKKTKPTPLLMSDIYAKPLPDPIHDTYLWHKEAVLKLLHKHGPLLFEKLDIWNESDLHQIFTTETKREPRSLIVPTWVIKINTIRNTFLNYFR